MHFEMVDIETKEYKDYKIQVIKKDKACTYKIYHITPSPLLIGAFLNELEEVIGLQILDKDDIDIYSTKRLIEIIEKGNPIIVDSCNEGDFIDWWNKEIYSKNTEEPNGYEDMYLTIENLEKYFIKTVTEDKTISNARWVEYYMNPPCGLSVQINKTRFNYNCQNIKKLTIYEHGSEKRIYCYDINDKFVEDIDISTKEPYINIRFVFEYGDLKNSGTMNEEQQAYIELYESLSPWQDVERNREIVKDWIEYHEKFINMCKLANGGNDFV